MSEPFRIGLNGKFLYGTAGVMAANEAKNLTDVTLDLGAITADTTSRASGKWKSDKAVLLEGTLQWTMHARAGNAALAAVAAAFFGLDLIALYPKDAESGEGLDADFTITKFTREEPLTGVIQYRCEGKPSDELREAQWH